MLFQNIQWHHFQRALMRGGKVHFGSAAFIMRLQKPPRAKTPAVTGFEARKLELRHRCAQIVADIFRIGQELCRHNSTHRMAALFGVAGVAVTVAEIPGHGV